MKQPNKEWIVHSLDRLASLHGHPLDEGVYETAAHYLAQYDQQVLRRAFDRCAKEGGWRPGSSFLTWILGKIGDAPSQILLQVRADIEDMVHRPEWRHEIQSSDPAANATVRALHPEGYRYVKYLRDGPEKKDYWQRFDQMYFLQARQLEKQQIVVPPPTYEARTYCGHLLTNEGNAHYRPPPGVAQRPFGTMDQPEMPPHETVWRTALQNQHIPKYGRWIAWQIARDRGEERRFLLKHGQDMVRYGWLQEHELPEPTPEEAAYFQAIRELADLPPEERLAKLFEIKVPASLDPVAAHGQKQRVDNKNHVLYGMFPEEH